MKAWLFKAVDNSPLIIFRIIFGFLITCESWGAIATGWVHRVLIEPSVNFHFIPFSFLHPLPGRGMYIYFFVMGVVGISIMLGYRYVLSSISFCLLWGGVYFMQKNSYNNHYYLLWLLSIIMIFLPANKNLSIDAKKGYTNSLNVMPNWVWFLIICQLTIVYTYASLAKLYPDWLDATVAKRLMTSRAEYPIIGELLQQTWTHYVIAYVGILFDLLIVPALLYKPTRKIAFTAAVFFHLYNSIVFQIGIFPYLALGFMVFFFPSDKVRKWFYPKAQKQVDLNSKPFPISKLVLFLITIWILVQFALPLRHWFIKGDVLWTEEGHRMSWRMMLRSKQGYNSFYILEEGIIKKQKIKLSDHLTPKQVRAMKGKPDLIWQFAQYLKKYYAKKGKTVKVFAKSYAGVNGGKVRQLVDPSIDLAATPWTWWKHNNWVLLYENK